MNRIIGITLMLFGLALMTSCTLVSEFSNSSGCLISEGGPIPGMSSGKAVVCRSGKDRATVQLEVEGETMTIRIKIEHGEQESEESAKPEIPQAGWEISAIYGSWDAEEPTIP